MPFTSSTARLAALLALAPFAAAVPAAAHPPVDLAPILALLAPGQTRAVAVPCSVKSYSLAGPPIVRVVSVTPGQNGSKLVLQATARGRTSVMLICEGDLQQDVSVLVR